MLKFDFTLILADGSDLTDAVADALFEAGCDDGSPGMSGGVFTIDFHREATSLEEAIRSAIAQVRQTGLGVRRVEIDADVPALAS